MIPIDESYLYAIRLWVYEIASSLFNHANIAAVATNAASLLEAAATSLR